MTNSGNKTKVVNLIPTYNEAENILFALAGLDEIAQKNKVYDWTTLVVDDTSPDGTAKLVQGYKSDAMNIELLSGPKAGLGVAMCKGLKYAIENLKADIIITNEADLAYDSNLIPEMLSKIKEGWDVVIGSRHVAGGKVQGWTFNRKLNHFIANQVFATWVAGVRQVKDHNGAFRAVKVKGILDRIDWDHMRIRGFGFFNYWCYLLTRLTDKIYEIPITYRFRTRGESKVTFNPKYLKTYLRDVTEYISLCFIIRKAGLHDRQNK